MSGRERKLYARRLIAVRLSDSQLRQIKDAAKVTGFTQTKIIEIAVGLYLQQLHMERVL